MGSTRSTASSVSGQGRESGVEMNREPSGCWQVSRCQSFGNTVSTLEGTSRR